MIKGQEGPETPRAKIRYREKTLEFSILSADKLEEATLKLF